MYLQAVILGLGFSALAAGIFISMRIFNIPDITTDGSFTSGGAVAAIMLSRNYNPLITALFVLLAGGIAGAATGIIHTKLKVNALLAGILVTTSLYSINLGIMQRSNIPLNDNNSIFFSSDNISNELSEIIILVFIAILLIVFLSWLLRTDFGLAMRATGNNEQMMRATGVNTDSMKVTGLAIANALTAFSGYLIVQIQGFADIGMGTGIVILGLGSVMIGEILLLLFRKKTIPLNIISVIIGAIMFRLILAFALSIGIDAVYLKLIVAIIVLLIVSIPNLKRS